MKNALPRWFLRIAFACYALVVLKLVLFRPHYSAYTALLADRWASANVMPFSTITLYTSGVPTPAIAFENIVGNVVLFLPLGLFVPLLLKRHSWLKSVLLSLVISALLEILQLLLDRGAFDVDDVILIPNCI